MSANAGPWQPIDTAPDEVEILVYVPAWGALIARFNAEFDEWTSRMQCPVSLGEDADRPTHWMPLPEPPQQQDDAAEPAGRAREAAEAGPARTGH